MSMKSDRRKVARDAGKRYGTMAADLSLIHISIAPTEETIQDHIDDLAYNIREQAAQQIRSGLAEDLAAVWKAAAFIAAQARLEAFGGPEEVQSSSNC